MMIKALHRLTLAAVVMTLAALPASASELREDGIHTEPWVKSMTFLDMSEDLAEAKAAGKTGLVIIFEQPGCGSCKKLHEVNFQDPAVVDTITSNFDVIIMNMYGANIITDFDGEKLSESEFSAKALINFSPTTLFYGDGGVEVFRIPGYLGPKFYQSGLEYVADGGPGRGILFPRWLKAKRDRLQAQQPKS